MPEYLSSSQALQKLLVQQGPKYNDLAFATIGGSIGTMVCGYVTQLGIAMAKTPLGGSGIGDYMDKASDVLWGGIVVVVGGAFTCLSAYTVVKGIAYSTRDLLVDEGESAIYDIGGQLTNNPWKFDMMKSMVSPLDTLVDDEAIKAEQSGKIFINGVSFIDFKHEEKKDKHQGLLSVKFKGKKISAYTGDKAKITSLEESLSDKRRGDRLYLFGERFVKSSRYDSCNAELEKIGDALIVPNNS